MAFNSGHRPVVVDLPDWQGRRWQLLADSGKARHAPPRPAPPRPAPPPDTAPPPVSAPRSWLTSALPEIEHASVQTSPDIVQLLAVQRSLR